MNWPKVKLFGQTLQNPIVISSGTYGYGLEQRGIALEKVGAVTLKSLSVEPLVGKPPPRIAEIRKEDIIECHYPVDELKDGVPGFVNCIGLQNCGIDIFLRDHAPLLKEAVGYHLTPSGVFEVPHIIVSIAGESIEEYVYLVERLQPDADWLLAIEVNISCPNVERGLVFGTDADLTHELISALVPISRIPLIVKLSPNTKDIRTIASAALHARANALSFINTIIVKARMRDGRVIQGGLSGPMIESIARRTAHTICRISSGIPVIAGGGVSCREDVEARLSFGATCVSVGTLNFRGEDAIRRLLYW